MTNPTAVQPLVPQQTPCPVPSPPDLSPESSVPNLNDYWPMEANSLLPSSIEQRMRQEKEERDRRLEKEQAEKETRELELQTQVEREKKGVSQLQALQQLQSMQPSVQGSLSGAQQALQKPQSLEQKPFTAERLRHQDFSVEEAFTQFSVLQGVKSRLRQFGYNFFDAQAIGFSSVQDVPVGPDYVIGPQDSLAVHIWNVPDPNFNRSYIAPVDRDGMLVIPQVGAIPIGGSTFAQAERAIRARLGSLLKRFDLHVSMARIRTMKVYVVGEIVRPGAYE
ncbi:MAG: polysaccharide biosynthesis/export family protein, partial [Nitrospiraceae bacterium]